MQIEGWMITSGFVLLTGILNYAIFRTGVCKDIADLIKRVNGHSVHLSTVDGLLAECVKKDDCKEDMFEGRREYEKSVDRIEQAVIRLETKIDVYIQASK